ncbi:MAG: tetratricopeptide repeat protein [Lewinellaceae bacterium]|nr:tetratricopeptide repeat protein [Lewinellaceae bacterium]
MPFALPIEPDPNSRLYNLKGFEQDRLQKRTAMLNEAIQQFNDAINLDPGYAPAYLNKACCFTLQNAWEDAAYWLSKYKAVKGSDPLLAMVLEGVQHALQQDSVGADRLFETAQKQGSVLADINLRKLRQLAPERHNNSKVGGLETIDQLVLEDFLVEPPSDIKEIKLASNIICGVKDYPHSKVLVHFADKGQRYAVVQLCGAGCGDATRDGIVVGNTNTQVEAVYGLPTRVVAQPAGGTVWVYPGLSLLFHFDRAGKVWRWGTYCVSMD